MKSALCCTCHTPGGEEVTFCLIDGIFTYCTHLGIPNVTFISPLPAKWKVFSVICVDGSPMLWAARSPTASPGSHSALCHFSCSNVLNLKAQSKKNCHLHSLCIFFFESNKGHRKSYPLEYTAAYGNEVQVSMFSLFSSKKLLTLAVQG